MIGISFAAIKSRNDASLTYYNNERSKTVSPYLQVKNALKMSYFTRGITYGKKYTVSRNVVLRKHKGARVRCTGSWLIEIPGVLKRRNGTMNILVFFSFCLLMNVHHERH